MNLMLHVFSLEMSQISCFFVVRERFAEVPYGKLFFSVLTRGLICLGHIL
jgi:hypothetical protein